MSDITDSHADAWALTADDYPQNAALDEKLKFLLGFAILAPSGRNTQPWLFQIHEDTVSLYADRTRALPVIDPEDRELVMSCGAALFQLRIALRRFALQGRVELVPDPSDRDLLARIVAAEGGEPSARERRLFDAIPKRHINRMLFEDREVASALVDTIHEAAVAENAWLRLIEGEEKRADVADLIGAGDRIQGADPDWRHEQAAFIRHNRTREEDGMPGYVFGVGDLSSVFGPLLIRTFDWGEGQAAKDRELAESAPVLAVLGSESDEPESLLAAGQALGSVLLHASAEGVSASFLNQPIQRPALRTRLIEILELDGLPQILLRLGYGPEGKPTPRRPVSDVLLGDE